MTLITSNTTLECASQQFYNPRRYTRITRQLRCNFVFDLLSPNQDLLLGLATKAVQSGDKIAKKNVAEV